MEESKKTESKIDLDKTLDEDHKNLDEYELEDYSSLKAELLCYIHEAKQSCATKMELLRRNNNAHLQRVNEEEIAKRDSSVKKNSAFIKRLRNMSASQLESLIKECNTLNLSKYLSEAAAAIVEARLKFTDIPAAVLLCTELNCIYSEFAGFLQDEYIKILNISKEEPVANANRLRVELCFYAELSLCGVIVARQSLPVLGTALTALTGDKTFNTLSLLVCFCKHCGADFAGLVPRRIRLLSEQFGESLNKSTLLALSKQESVRNLLLDYYTSLCSCLQNKQVKLSAYENQNRQILLAKGEVRPDRVTNAEVLRSEIQSLLGGAVTLAELLDVELPDLPDTELQEVAVGDGEDGAGGHVWEDEETTHFYTQLPDVKDYLDQIRGQDESTDKTPLNVSDPLLNDDGPNKKAALETFLKLLPECKSRIMIDNAALEFLLCFNTKAGRKKLIVTLFMVPRSRLELLPFYARFTAIMSASVPEISTTLCQQLKSEMLRHIHKKDQVNLESKKKTVKYVGELVNFGVFNRKDILKALKMLLLDFTHHNVEMACCLLETCGRSLYVASDSHLSTKYYLDQMMRLKTVLAMDARYVTLVETAYYHVLPPVSASAPPTTQLPVCEQFITQLIRENLMKPGSDTCVLNALRSLDWDCSKTAAYAVACLTNATNVSYPRIRNLAQVVSMLDDYQEDAVCQVVDGVLEDIRLGMELNGVSFNQRRVAMVKYLGELYNYRLLDTSDILKVLYSLISFGVRVDPPASVIRLHLVLLLLGTCVFNLSNVDTALKLKYYIVYFQHYYWVKRSSPVWSEDRPFPSDIVYRFQDVLQFTCPDFQLAKDLEESVIAVNDLNNKMCAEATKDNPNLASFLSTVVEDTEVDADESHQKRNTRTVASSKKPNMQLHKDIADEVFLTELNNIISDSFKGTDNHKAKKNVDIAVPLNYRKSLSDGKPQFVMLLKKGNKQTCKTLTLPPDHDFVLDLKSKEEASKQEKENVKRITLNINERLQDNT